jgi:hypothetical protein
VDERQEPVSARRERPAQTERGRSAGFFRRSSIGPSAIIALAALVGFVVWLVIESGGNSNSNSNPTPTTSTNPPVAVSLSGLRTLAKAVPEPIYWVGSRPGTQYEVTKTTDRVYLRYLPPGAGAGDSRPFLTIGTYALRNAFEVMKASAKEPDTQVVDVPGGGVAVINDKKLTNVYLAYPGSNFQVEVYSPDVSAARQLATSGRVEPVVETAQSQSSGPKAASRDELASLAASVGHPIYWAGPRAGTTYELTKTDSGRTYVRYVPNGVPVGAKRAYLTIATYPLENAYAVTKAAGKDRGTVTMKLPNGRIAVYTKQSPTNIHLADPDSVVQVEVYDASPKVARRVVSSGLVVPVG